MAHRTKSISLPMFFSNTAQKSNRKVDRCQRVFFIKCPEAELNLGNRIFDLGQTESPTDFSTFIDCFLALLSFSQENE